jgi:hypothetical protein
MNNVKINNKLEITDARTLRLIENKRIKNCIECMHCKQIKLHACTIYPAMTDMIACYKFEKVN